MRRLLLVLKKLRRRVHRFLISPIYKMGIKKCGKNVTFGERISINFENLSIGDNSSIGSGALFMSSRAEIKIGSNVMIAPNVTIVTGNHRIDIVGRYMNSVKDNEKLESNDQNVVIEDDVWIGANATILKGVTIQTGSVVAAGSVVTKNTEAYSVNAGVPARKIAERFSVDELKMHLNLISGE